MRAFWRLIIQAALFLLGTVALSVAIVVAALAIWLATGQAAAPFPRLELPFAHTPDWFYAPQIAFLGAQVPEEARARLLALDLH